MPLTMTTVTGPVYLPNGATPFGGRVSFELSSWDVEEEEGLVITGPVYVTIDENGQFSVNLFTTTAGSESVTYRMFVIWEDSVLSQSYVNDIYVSVPMPHYTKKYIGSFVLSGPGPYSLSELNIVSELNNSSFDVYLEMKAFVDRIDLGAIDDAVETVESHRVQTGLDAGTATAARLGAEVARDAAITAADDAEIAASAAAASATAADASAVAAASVSYTRGLRGTFDGVEPLNGIRDEVVIEKRRTDFIEFAVYSALDRNGIDWIRHFSSVRLLPGAVGAPDYTIGTLAQLHATAAVPILAATGGGGITAASPTSTQAASAATRTGTWTGPTTVSGVTNSYYTTTLGDTIQYTIACNAGDVVYSAHPSNFTNGGVVAVSVTISAVPIAAGDYLCPLVGAERLFSTRQDNGTLGVAALFRAASTGSYVVTLQLSTTTPGSSRLYTQRLDAYAALTGTSAAGAYGSITTVAIPGQNANLTYHPGHTFVLSYNDCTEINFAYWQNTVCGEVSFKVYDSGGTLVTGLTTTDLDMYGSALVTAVEVMSGKPKGDYKLHVFFKNTKNAASTDYRLYFLASTAADETTAGIVGVDPFNILDMPTSPSAGVFGTHVLLGPGNLFYASEWRPAAAVSWPGGDNFVSGVHGEETALTNANLTVTVDGAVVGWNAAIAGATFVGKEVIVEFSTTLNFPSTATPFATLARKITYRRGGVMLCETTRTLTADATCGNDYILMLQCPNGGNTYSDSVGEGFEDWALERAGNFFLGLSDDATTISDAWSEAFACWNDRYAATVTLMNPHQVRSQYSAFIVGTNNVVMRDNASHTSKTYLRSAGAAQSSTGFTMSSGHVARVVKIYRVMPCADAEALGAA